jgi:alkylhydroperoxidase family enzyme
MARLPYTPANISEPAELVAAMRARRGGALLEVERMMLHSPALAAAWSGFFSHIKSNTQISARLRELVACTVGIANGAAYQLAQHGPIFIAAGGSQAQLAALADPDSAAMDSLLFDETERAVISLALEMTRTVKISDETFARARDALMTQPAIVELIGVVAAYNLVSRFLVALEIGQFEEVHS